MFVDMETEIGNAGPESEVGVVWTGIETPEEEQNRTRMVCVKGEGGREGEGRETMWLSSWFIHTYSISDIRPCIDRD